MEMADSYVLKEYKKQKPTRRDICIIGLKVLVLLIVFFIGFIIGYFAMSKSDHSTTPNKGAVDNTEALHDRLVSSLQAERLEHFSRYEPRVTETLITMWSTWPVTTSVAGIVSVTLPGRGTHIVGLHMSQ